MSGNRVVFRCRFGKKVGWGHVIRCGALASAFRDAGWETVLWSSDSTVGLPDETKEIFSEVVSDDAASRLPAGSRVLVVDEMYAPDEELADVCGAFRRCTENPVTIGIDDMQRRTMEGFDVVLNTEIGLERAEYKCSEQLLGERYALLREGFRQPEIPNVQVGLGRLVFVMLGGTDAFGFLPECLEGLNLMQEETPVYPVVVVGDRLALGKEVERALGLFPRVKVLSALSSREVAGWMKVANFGVIGCGTSLYEAAAMQLPFVGICLVDNQRATAVQVERSWKQPVLFRDIDAKSEIDWLAAFSRLGNYPKTQYAAVDGLGSRRVAEAVLAISRRA